MQEQGQGRRRTRRLFDLLDRAQAWVLACLPTEVADHLTKAQKEGVLALKSYLDECIERIDERMERAKEYRERGGEQ